MTCTAVSEPWPSKFQHEARFDEPPDKGEGLICEFMLEDNREYLGGTTRLLHFEMKVSKERGEDTYMWGEVARRNPESNIRRLGGRVDSFGAGCHNVSGSYHGGRCEGREAHRRNTELDMFGRDAKPDDS